MSKNRPNRKTRKAAARVNASDRVTKQPIQIVVRKEIFRIPASFVVRDMDRIVIGSDGIAKVGSAVIQGMTGFRHSHQSRI